MKGGYFLVNGRFHKEEEAVFSLAELTCRSEGFREVFRAEHNEILFAPSISQQLIYLAGSLDIETEGVIDPEGRLLRKDVSRLLNKNKLYLAAKVEIQLFLSAGKTQLVLRATETERGYYPLKETGLLVHFYQEHRRDLNGHPDSPLLDSFLQNAARRKAAESSKPNLILLNTNGCPCESIGGSFGYLVKNKIYLPSHQTGGYRCAIRKEIMESIAAVGFQIVETDQITGNDLLNAEEVFLFDACHGIQKVLGLEEQRYYSTKTQLIAEKLSELARKEREEIIN